MRSLGIMLSALVGTAAALRVSGLENALVRERKPFDLLTIQPTYAISDWAAARRLMDEYVDVARTSTGCSYCGWTMCESTSQLFVSEAYRDAEAARTQLANAAPILKRLLAGPASLELCELHGPPAELARAELRAIMPEGTEYFEACAGGYSFFSKQTGGLMTGQTLCSIKPTYRVSDWDAASLLVDELLERAAVEPGCIYCGVSRSSCGELLSVRSAHSNAAGLLEHLANVGAQLAQLASGPAQLERMELHGPPMQIERCKGSAVLDELAGENLRSFVTRGGFQRFEAWSSYVAQPNPEFG